MKIKRKTIEKRIFECPKHKEDVCPVAKKFKKINGKLPVPEAYLGNLQSKFMIIGINPGASKNYLPKNFEEYRNQIKESVHKRFWQYHHVTQIFGYPPLKKGGGIITNLIHCPTKSWSKNRYKQWWLNSEDKIKSIELCSKFCFDIIEKVDPELILLHGLDVIKFFSGRCKWGISKNVKSKDINGRIRVYGGRTFVLSQHLVSIRAEKNQGAWKALKEAAKKLKS